MKVTIRIKEDRKKWDELTKSAASMKKGGSYVDIGLFAEEGSDHLVEYASKNEFGDPAHTFHGRPAPIPERSFMRSTFDENYEAIIRQVEKARLEVLLGRLSKGTFLKRLGQWFEGKVKEKIDQAMEWAVPKAVPRAPAETMALESAPAGEGDQSPVDTASAGKGDQSPVDTGRLKQSITHKLSE